MVRATLSFTLFSFVIIIPLIIWMIKKEEKISQILLYSIFIIYIFGAIAQVCLPINFNGMPVSENIKNFPYSEFIYITPFKQEYFDIHQTDAVLRLVKSYLLNILLTIPFGILFPLIKKIDTRSMMFIAVFVGLLAETFQLATGLLFGIQFRITHIDDVMMNALGVMIGYAIFKIGTHKYNTFVS